MEDENQPQQTTVVGKEEPSASKKMKKVKKTKATEKGKAKVREGDQESKNGNQEDDGGRGGQDQDKNKSKDPGDDEAEAKVPEDQPAQVKKAAPPLVKRRTLLVIGGSSSIDWPTIFKDSTLHGGRVEVHTEMAAWEDIRLVSYSDCGCVVDIAPPKGSRKSVTPDFLLVRSALQGVQGQDYRNSLYGFMHSAVPSINSLDSLYFCQNKPIVYGKLRSVQKRLGKDAFPLIEQACYADWRAMTFVSGFPLVAKLGTAHAGFGKMKINDQSAFEDFQSVVALQDRYVTTEPFIDWDYDFRIQKIGDNYRAFRRYSSNWKGKGFNQKDEDIPVTPLYKRWIDEASKALGGMDICALDGVHSRADGREHILELNDSAIGLNSRYEEEDLTHIRDLVLMRMTQAFPLHQADHGGRVGEDGRDDNSQDTNHESVDDLRDQITKLRIQLDASTSSAPKPTTSGPFLGFRGRRKDKH